MCSNSYPPLHSRVVTSKPLSSCCPLVLRPQLYRVSYTVEQMDCAYKAVLEGKMSVRRAAEEYDVPRSTLGDRVSGRVLPCSVSGRKPYLSREEDELVSFLVGCAGIGFPRGRKEVIALVQRVCDGRGHGVMISHGWWERFCC